MTNQENYYCRYYNRKWIIPNTSSGYVYISVSPLTFSICSFRINPSTYEVTKIKPFITTNYYYTIDKETYYCNEENKEICSEITNSEYYFTVSSKSFYCEYEY